MIRNEKKRKNRMQKIYKLFQNYFSIMYMYVMLFACIEFKIFK